MVHNIYDTTYDEQVSLKKVVSIKNRHGINSLLFQGTLRGIFRGKF